MCRVLSYRRLWAIFAHIIASLIESLTESQTELLTEPFTEPYTEPYTESCTEFHTEILTDLPSISFFIILSSITLNYQLVPTLNSEPNLNATLTYPTLSLFSYHALSHKDNHLFITYMHKANKKASGIQRLCFYFCNLTLLHVFLCSSISSSL